MKALYWFCLFALFLVVMRPARAQNAVEASVGPRAGELTWAVWIETGVYRWGHTATPVLDEVTYLGQPISRHLRPSVVELVGVAADFHRDAWLVTASLHRSAGLGSASSVRRPNTLTVVPVVPALTVAEAGVTYQFLQTTHGTQLNAQLLFRHQLTVVESRSDWKLFGANLRSSQLLLAVPVSQHLGRLTLQGHLGTTILSRHQTSYDLLLRVYEESLERPVSHPTLVRYEAGAPTTWLAQVGAAFALGDVLVSTAVHAERTTLRRVYEETVWGLELSVGWGR